MSKFVNSVSKMSQIIKSIFPPLVHAANEFQLTPNEQVVTEMME